MKRNQFILSALTVAIAPLAAVDQNKKIMQRTGRGFKINAADSSNPIEHFISSEANKTI
jgi:hypothetical protein